MPESKKKKTPSKDKKSCVKPKKKASAKGKKASEKKTGARPKKQTAAKTQKTTKAAPKQPKAQKPPESPEKAVNAEFVEFEIPIDKIVLGEHQPRTREDISSRGELTKLRESIRSVGLLQPILVQEQGDGTYLLISGERRYTASKQLGHSKIRAVLPSNRTIHALEERGKTLDELALFENLQRKNLTPIEEGRCYQKLLGLLEVTQTELAERLGLKQPYINERIGFLQLPEEVQELIEDAKITTSQARELGRLKELPDEEREEKQIELAQKMLAEKLTVRKAKKLVNDALGKEDKRDGAQLTRLGAKKAAYFIATLNQKFDEIDLAELQEEGEEERLQQLQDDLPQLIKKLQRLKKDIHKII